MKIFFKKNLWYFCGFTVLAWVVFANLFPKGFVLAGGDVAQLINPLENLKTLFYDWQGRAFLFNSIFWLLAKIGISDTGQLSCYLGVFIVGSYISFDLFCRILFKKTGGFLRMLVSLFYALNLYTLYIFSYNWGYSYYQSLYIFVPVLVALFARFLETRKNIWGAGFALVLFLSSSGFGNPAFALSLGMLLVILTISLGAFEFFRWDKEMAKKLGTLAAFSLAVNVYWIFPLIPQMRGGVANLFSGNIIDLNWWLAHTSNPLADTLRLSQYSNWYFPDNFPYPSLLKYRFIFVALSILPIMFAASGLFFWKKMAAGEKKYFLIFFVALFFLIMFVGKVRPPFEVINKFFYNIWGMNTLRGYEKFAIYTPFVFSALVLLSARAWVEGNIFRKVVAYICLVFILIAPLPFFLGKLHQNMSAVFVRDTVSMEAKNFQKAKYSFLVKIPEEYYEIRKIINSDEMESRVAILPYNAVDSLGWSNYPKWKLAGSDITARLYNKKFIDANAFYFGDWLPAKDFAEADDDPKWIAELLGMMNSKYIIFHKDTEPQFLESSLDKIGKLETRGIVKLLEKNDYFNLYSIDEKYFLPLLRFQKESAEIEPNANSVASNFAKIKNSSSTADFQKINPKKFEVGASGVAADSLVFAEPYDSNWKAYAVKKDGGKYELKNHYKEAGFANGWKIENEKELSKIIVEYYPMRLAYRGIFLSAIAVLFLIGYSLFIWKKNLN